MDLSIILEWVAANQEFVEIIKALLIILAAIYALIKEFFIHLRIFGFIKRQLILSFDRVEKGVKKLNIKIKKSNFNPTVIIGIAGDKYVGGPVLASLIGSRKYRETDRIYIELPRDSDGAVIWNQADPYINVIIPQIKSYLTKRKKKLDILLVDDVSKSGDTVKTLMDKISNKLKNINHEIKIAVMAVKKDAYKNLGKDFWDKHFTIKKYLKVKNEVVFPWSA